MLTKNGLVKSNLYASNETIDLEVAKIEAVNETIEVKTFKTKETKKMAKEIKEAEKAKEKKESTMTPQELIASFKEARQEADAKYIAKKEQEAAEYKALLAELRGRNDIYCAIVDKALSQGKTRLTLAEAIAPTNMQLDISKRGNIYHFINDFGKAETIYIPDKFTISYTIGNGDVSIHTCSVSDEDMTEEAFIKAGRAFHTIINNMCKVYDLIPEKAPTNWRYQTLKEVKASDRKFFSSYYKAVVQSDSTQLTTFVNFINKLGNLQGYNTYIIYKQLGNQYRVDFNKRELVEIKNSEWVSGPNLATYIKDEADHFDRCCSKGITVIDVEDLRWNIAQLIG